MTVEEEQLIRQKQAKSEKHPIQISGRIVQKLYPKVNPAIFLHVLQDKISLSDYGDGVYKYYFTFVVMEIQPNFSNWVGIDYYRNTRSVDIGIEIPPEKALQASQAETIHLMEEAFLKGIDQIATLQLAAPFDYLAFKRDVQAIFDQEGWYEEVMQQ